MKGWFLEYISGGNDKHIESLSLCDYSEKSQALEMAKRLFEAMKEVYPDSRSPKLVWKEEEYI